MDAALCLNCGAQLGGKFCSACGQEHLGREPRLRDLAKDLLEEFANLDGKVLQSLRLLFIEPGSLTTAFMEGRRASFVSPLKLYLACSAAFFLAAQQMGFADSLVAGAQVRTTGGEEAKQLILSIMRQAAVVFEQNMEHIFILTVPFTGLASWTLFRGRRLGLLQHLVFVIHNWSATFLILAVLGVAQLPMPFFRLMLICSFVYQVFAVRRVFRAKWPESLVKSLMLSSATLVAVVVVFGGLCIDLAIQKRSEFRKLEQGQAPQPSEPLLEPRKP